MRVNASEESPPECTGVAVPKGPESWPGASSFNVTAEFGRNANSQVSPHTH